MSTVLTEKITPKSFDKSEIFRYLGIKNIDKTTENLIDECLFECKNSFSYSVCYGEFPVYTENNIVCFPFVKMASSDLSKKLTGFKKAVVFASTVGIDIDRLISKYSKISPSKAVIFQAIGAERIEALCDAFCDKLKYNKKTVRYSPGYGDLSIEYQKEILTVLNANKNIGISLNSSFLMSPSKSVTAILGVK